MKKWLFLSVLFLFSCEKEYIDLPDGIGNMGDPNPNNNTWEHYVYTIGSGKAKFFRNGEFLGEIDVGTSVIKLGSDFAMGRMNHPSWDALSGRLDDIAIYNRVLTTDEITGINKL